MKKIFILIVSCLLFQSVSAQKNPKVLQAFKQLKGKSIQLKPNSGQLPLLKKNYSNEWQTKVDPSLTKLIYTGSEKQVAKGRQDQVNRASKQKITVFRDKSGVLKAPVFIEYNTIGGSDLEGFEIRRLSPNKDIAIGYIELDKVPSIASNASVKRIQAAKRHKTKKVEGIKSIKADLLHAGTTNFPDGIKGKDVVVGILDSGIDFDLDVFSDANGTRIQYLLEYTMTETETDFIYGQNEWTKTQIDANPQSVTEKDGYGGGGHGTHVASIAAGNDANGTYPTGSTGVAPESDIIFVKGDRDPNSNSGFSDDDIVDGVAYIFEKAAILGKPAVVNLSLGSNYGPLDGTGLYDRYLTQLTGEGKIIVAAAGNEGFDFLHTGYQNSEAKVVASVDVTWDDMSFDKYIWSDAGVISAYKVIALDKNTLEEVGSSGWLTKGSSNWDDTEPIRITDSTTDDNAGFLYHYSDEGIDPQNGDEYIQIYLYDGYDSDDDEDYAWIDDYLWVVAYQTTATEGRIDAISNYASSYPDLIPVANATFIPGDQALSVGSPATAKNVVSVGAYVTSTTWTDISNVNHQTEYPTDFYYTETKPPVSGDLAYFSSRGPTRDNRLAPIITAPGDLIFSNRSFDIENEDLDAEVLTEGGKLIGYQGTSMASPFVAGTVALMLQMNPNLDYDDIVDIFTAKSITDAQTGNVPSTSWGHGKLDAYESVLEAYNTTTSIESEQNGFDGFNLIQNYPNPFNPTTTIRFTINTQATVNMNVYDVVGREVVQLLTQKSYSKGVYSIEMNASNLASGVYWVRLIQQNQNGSNSVRVLPITLIK